MSSKGIGKKLVLIESNRAPKEEQQDLQSSSIEDENVSQIKGKFASVLISH